MVFCGSPSREPQLWKPYSLTGRAGSRAAAGPARQRAQRIEPPKERTVIAFCHERSHLVLEQESHAGGLLPDLGQEPGGAVELLVSPAALQLRAESGHAQSAELAAAPLEAVGDEGDLLGIAALQGPPHLLQPPGRLPQEAVDDLADQRLSGHLGETLQAREAGRVERRKLRRRRRRVRRRCSRRALAVIATMRGWRSGGSSARMRRVASRPSIPGIWMSIRIRS